MNSYFKNISFDKFINYLIIGLAFLLPITKAGNVLFVHLIILSFIFRGNFSHIFVELKKSKVIVTISLFLALSLISVTWSSDKIFALLYIKKYYHFLIIPIIYLSFNTKYIKHVFNGFLLGMLFSEIMSYGIFFELIEFNNISPNDPSPFMNHSDYSIYLAFTSLILLNRVFFSKNRIQLVFYFLYFLTTTSNLFLNGGRTGQIILIATLFVVLFLNFKNKIKAILIATILAIGIVTIAYSISPVFKSRGTQAYNDITNTIINKDYSGSFGQRVSLWIMGANIFKDNFLLGTGIGDEKTGMQKYAHELNVPLYQNLADKGDIDYHSMYIQHAAQLGFLGLFLVLYLVYSIFIMEFKSVVYRNINIAYACTILIASTVSNLLHSLFPMMFFAFFVALLSAISKSESVGQYHKKND